MAIARAPSKSKPVVGCWQERYLAQGVEGLRHDASRPDRKPLLSADIIERVIEMTLHDTPLEATHWSVRSMARATGIRHTSVQRIWKEVSSRIREDF